MTVPKFEQIVSKVTKQYGTWCEKTNTTDWNKHKEFLSTLLIRNKLLRTDQSSEFWRATGTTCDFLDEANRKPDLKDWKWQSDVAFCILFMDNCMKKWTHRRKSKEDDE